MGKKIIAVFIAVVSVVGIAAASFQLLRQDSDDPDNITEQLGGWLKNTPDRKEEPVDAGLVGKYGPFEYIVNYEISNSKLIIGYIQNGKYWVEVDGKKFGPYDHPNLLDFNGPEEDDNFVHYETHASDDSWLFAVRKDGQWYVNVEGKEFGPYSVVINADLSGSDFGFSYQQREEIFFNINGQVFGPYGPYSLKSTFAERRYYGQMDIADGKWMFAYQDRGKCYSNISGENYGPFRCGNDSESDTNDWTGDWISTDRMKHWAFFYSKDGSVYLKTDRAEYGPFPSSGEDNDGYLVGLEGERMIYTYPRSDQWYFSVDGKEYGPYPEVGSVIFRKAGWTAEYVREGKNWLMVNGREFGPFEVLAGNIGEKHFIYEACLNIRGAECYGYAIVDGESYGPYDNVEAMRESGDEWGFSFKRSGAWYANLNGKEYGPYYQKDPICPLDSFSEDIEIEESGSSVKSGMIGYPFQTADRKWRLNISGKEYGPFEEVGCTHFLSNDGQVALNYRQKDGWYVEVLPR